MSQTPWVLLLVGDFGAHSNNQGKRLPIDPTNPEEALGKLWTKFSFEIPNTLKTGPQTRTLLLDVGKLSDFKPERVLHSLEGVKELLVVRSILKKAADGGGGASAFESELQEHSAKSAEVDPLLRTLFPQGIAAGAADSGRIGEAIERLDSMLGAQLDAALQHPTFQTVEGAWRGLAAWAARVEKNPLCRFEILSVPKGEWVETFKKEVFQPEYDEIPEEPLSLVGVDFDFTAKPVDLGAMVDLAQHVKVIQVPIFAGVSPEFFEMSSMAHVAAFPDIPKKLSGPAYARWNQFQRDDASRWIGLGLGRFLLREPHEIDEGKLGFNYKESADDARPESFLWGRGMWLAMASIARSLGTLGHPLSIGGVSEGAHKGLPVRQYPKGPNQTAAFPTEAPFPEQTAWEFSMAGFSPLVGKLNGDVAYFPLIVDVHRLNPGKVTSESSFAHQLLAGRLAQRCTQLLPDLVGLGQEEAFQLLRNGLHNDMGPLQLGSPEETVEISLQETPDGGHAAQVTVHCATKIEGKEMDFTLMLPVG